jgi:hypothetical protein
MLKGETFVKEVRLRAFFAATHGDFPGSAFFRPIFNVQGSATFMSLQREATGRSRKQMSYG